MADLEATTKRCTRCATEKPFEAFSKEKLGRFGLRSVCRPCAVAYVYSRKGTVEVEEKRCCACGVMRPRSEFYSGFGARDGLSSRCRPCHEAMDCRSGDRRAAQRRAIVEQGGGVFLDSAERERRRLLRKADAELRRAERDRKKAEARVRSQLREKIKNQIKKKRRKGHLDWRIRDSLVHDRWSPTILKALGYTVSDLKLHLERQFTKDMDWSAFAGGAIHIDHIIPVRMFDLTTDEGVRACWAMTNLRPMWAAANIAKGGERTLLL